MPLHGRVNDQHIYADLFVEDSAGDFNDWSKAVICGSFRICESASDGVVYSSSSKATTKSGDLGKLFCFLSAQLEGKHAE